MADIRNLELLAHFYEFTMTNSLFHHGLGEKIAYFDLFFRKIPDDGGYSINAGLEQVIEFIQNLHYTKEDIEYLRGCNKFSEEFLEYLQNFKFTGDLWAIPEGTVTFPNEPKIIVRAPIIQCGLIGGMALLHINHQSLIATKASRIVYAAKGKPVVELGVNRAHNVDAAIYGARAAAIAGVSGTSCVRAAKEFNIPVYGTMGHYYVQFFDSEYLAFKAYGETYPSECSLPVDTYSTLNSGVPNAIRAFNDVIVPKGYRPKSIRLDSGNLAYISKEARMMLDEAGFSDCKIVANNSLDEYSISSLIEQGVEIDIWGVGEKLITAKSNPVLGGVYKLCAIESEGRVIPKMKISDDEVKTTTPGFKRLYRFYDNQTGKAIADLLTLDGETISTDEYSLFDAVSPWKVKVIRNYIVKPLLVPIFQNGELVYKLPALGEITQRCLEDLESFDDRIKCFENPLEYGVHLSGKIWELKQKVISDYKVQRKGDPN